MKDDITPRCGPGHELLIEEVATDELDLGTRGKPLKITLGKIIQTDNLPPIGHEPPAEMGADEPGCTRNETPHSLTAQESMDQDLA